MQLTNIILAIAALASVTMATKEPRSCRKQNKCNVEGEIKCGKYYKADAVYRCKGKCWVMDPLCSEHEGCFAEVDSPCAKHQK